MAIKTASARQYLRNFDFPALFIEELGWDRLQISPVTIDVEGETYLLHPVAEKRGVQIFRCDPDANGRVPPYPIRQKIDRAIAKIAYEHLIIYVDATRSIQVWQWVKREPSRPAAYREQTHHHRQSGEALLQKLARITFAISDEEHLTIDGVTVGMRDAFDKDRVTKRFYDRFKDEHQAFHNFISGITSKGDQDWYASIMLNRLMFVYFIQKKGFLDNDTNYLQTRLKAMQNRDGDENFHSFYRYFLLKLFHQGLGARKDERSPELDELLGDVPYLNGGLFDVHALEEDNPHIQIPDEAFAKLFSFFDEYTWHLDDRPLAAGNEINPDVLGYIFEKYINQKQMGAYYTKEDITGYISRNTILPWILDKAREDCTIAFRPEQAGNVWRLLRDDPDTYIYDAVKHGVIDEHGEIIPLPDEIAAGLDDVTKRGGWNRTAPDPYALPTETWREHVARRQRCLDLRQKLRDGEIHTADDLITYNLDIVQFAQDVIETSEGPELLRAMYKAIRNVSVLDPTCGSGAFLFAALNILDPLHDACLDRMQAFVTDLDQSGTDHSPEKYRDFRKALAELERHPSQGYFVLKQIVLNNLYGVDIMAEAVEICKLRLFLKLVAQLDDKSQIEPLPDIDFNIRAGNTLVGFATRAEVARSLTMGKPGQVRMLLDDDRATLARIEEQLAKADLAFEHFREIQQHEDDKGGQSLADAKAEYRERLSALNDELDRYQAGLYGINPDWPKTVAAWKESHQPFHWFVDFHGIMSTGGFDVIIGNPPYIATSKVRKQYKLVGYETNDCSDIYASVLERTSDLLGTQGRSGMIVPLSLTFSGNFERLRTLLDDRYAANWFSSFARIPAALFSADVRVRNTIHIGRKGKGNTTSSSTVLHRWFEEARPHLFTNLSYAPYSAVSFGGLIPKVNTPSLAAAFEDCFRQTSKTVESSISPFITPHELHFKKTAYNWLNFCLDQPPSYAGNGEMVSQTKFGTVAFPDPRTRDAAFLFLNGKIMFGYWCLIGDDFDLTRWMFASFPIDLASVADRDDLLSMANELDSLMRANTSFKLNAGKRVGNYNLAKCRALTDLSDAIFAEHLGLTEVWDDIELLYAQIVKTDFSGAGDDDA